MKAVKTINPKYGVPTSKPRGSKIVRVAAVEQYTQGVYVPKKVTTEAEDILNNLNARETDPIKGSLFKGEISFNNYIGRIEKSLKRRKAVYEYTPDGYFQVWIDTYKNPEMFTYYIGVDYDTSNGGSEKVFVVLDVEEREIMCVEGNELSHIMAWFDGFNDIEGRGKLLLRTDLIEE